MESFCTNLPHARFNSFPWIEGQPGYNWTNSHSICIEMELPRSLYGPDADFMGERSKLLVGARHTRQDMLFVTMERSGKESDGAIVSIIAKIRA